MPSQLLGGVHRPHSLCDGSRPVRGGWVARFPGTHALRGVAPVRVLKHLLNGVHQPHPLCDGSQCS
jgi:hypothetical protein